MENKRILAIISKKMGNIILLGILVSAFSFLVLVVKEKNYKVSTDYLIVQNQTGNQDFYTVTKSAEYIGKVLNEAVYSELFIDEVVKTGKVNAEFLPFDKKQKLKEWANMVQVSTNPDLGIISVEIFNNDKDQAAMISRAASEVLTTKNSLFRGDGQNIQVKVLTGPVLENNPSIANIIASTTGGFVLGVMLSILWLVFKEDRRRKAVFSNSSSTSISNDVLNSYAPVSASTLDKMQTTGNFLSDEEKQQILSYLEK